MKNIAKIFGIITLAVVIGFSMTACPDGNGDGGGGGEVSGTTVPGENLTEKLAWLKDNAEDGKEYSVTVGENEEIAPTELDYSGKKVKINMHGGSATLASNGDMFRLRAGVTLTLSNITLNGKTSNSDSIINVYNGTLIMEDGSKITGNTMSLVQTSSGGGVYVLSSGTFIMNGGEISGNTLSNTVANGGGVYVGGTFTMNGGKISGNTSAVNGGGVFVATDATFTMNGGEIAGNSAARGGGVYVYFNTTTNLKGTFRISKGTIYGSNEDTESLRNKASSTNGGSALYVLQTAIAECGTTKSGVWTKTENGDLSTTDDTIEVENGVRQAAE